MDDQSYTIRVPKRWVRVAMIVGVTALVVAPLTAVATHSFTDVPSSNTHHNDIAWLKSAEVTRGCNPPANTQYCPNDFVTRAQMATFLRNLAENQLVDAGTLAGNSPDVYRTVVAADLDSDISSSLESSETQINSVDITAPAAGVLVVSGSAFLSNQTGGDDAVLGLRPKVNGTHGPGPGGNAALVVLDAGLRESLAYTVVFEVEAGTHTVTQTASVLDSFAEPIGGDFAYNANNLTVTWHPEGSISLAAASNTGSGLLGD